MVFAKDERPVNLLNLLNLLGCRVVLSIHILFLLPLRGSLSCAFGAPLLQGATQRSCNSGDFPSHQSPVTSHQKRNRFRDSFFLFLESAVKFHFHFAAGGAVSAPAAASTAADGGMIDVTAGKNEEDGDHRHHSIDSGIHRKSPFVETRIKSLSDLIRVYLFIFVIWSGWIQG